MTHPGVGALTALAFVLVIGNVERFGCGKQIASYLGLVPAEESSGERRRLGHISKQGSALLRFFLVEAAQVTVRSDPEWRSKFFHLAMRRGRKIAKVAMARRLAVRMYWMWREQKAYEQLKKSVRTRASPEQALLCNRPARNRRVEDWPGALDSAYLLLPVSSGSASLAESYAGFQPPPPQTQRADFPHWAFLCVSHQGLCGRFMLIGFQLLARTTR